jgi:oxygen-dependent protoporphyrinogen oxidase
MTGLVAARDLARSGAEVTLIEADERLGGKVRTLEVRGAVVEAGPDWFLTRNPAALELAREVGLEGDLVEPARAGACIYVRGRLAKLPVSAVRGVPLDPWEAVRAGLIGAPAALRAMADLVLPGKVTGEDVSVGRLIRRRLGAEVLERMVDPMLAASRAGRADDLSLRAAAPELDEAARRGPSIIRGLRAMRDRSQAGSPAPGFLGLSSGMERLVETVAAGLQGVDVRTGTGVRGLEPADGGYVLEAGGAIEADRVLLAVPAHAAAEQVRGSAPRAAQLLGTIRYASAAVASLVYRPGEIHAHGEGSGFLVPTAEGKAVTAGAWYSLKWPHAAPADGSLVVRCFAGRAHNDPVLDVDATSDADLIERMASEIGDIAGTQAVPDEFHLTRWPRALPQYEVGHNARVEALASALADELPGVLVAGAGYRGSGLPDCISQGREAARRLLAAG